MLIDDMAQALRMATKPRHTLEEIAAITKALADYDALTPVYVIVDSASQVHATSDLTESGEHLKYLDDNGYTYGPMHTVSGALASCGEELYALLEAVSGEAFSL